MIPISSKEFVDIKDSDGMLFKFKPKSGTMETELFNVYEEGLDIRNSGGGLMIFSIRYSSPRWLIITVTKR